MLSVSKQQTSYYKAMKQKQRINDLKLTRPKMRQGANIKE
jgi:hypothetical protein